MANHAPSNTPYSYSDAKGDGAKTSFPFSFVGGYFRDRLSDIHAYVRNSDPSDPAYDNWKEVDIAQITPSGTDSTPSTLTLRTAPPAPTDGRNNVRIRRIMPKDAPYIDPHSDSIFRKEPLYRTFMQQLYAGHEVLDGYVGNMLGLVGDFNVFSNKIVNLKAGTKGTDAVNLAQLEKLKVDYNQAINANTQANSHASAALSSENGAHAAQVSAEQARDRAKDWAEKPEDHEVVSSQYSAMHWALKAKEGINTIKGSLSAANQAVTDAKVVKAQVDTLKSEAEAIKPALNAIKTAADTSAHAAASSATAAAQSAKAAHDSAVEAADSAHKADLAKAGAEQAKSDTDTVKSQAQTLLDQVKQSVTQSIKSGGVFNPSAAKEYPDKPTVDTLWIIGKAYKFTKGDLQGKTVRDGSTILFDVQADRWVAFSVLGAQGGVQEINVPSGQKTGTAITLTLADFGAASSTALTDAKADIAANKSAIAANKATIAIDKAALDALNTVVTNAGTKLDAVDTRSKTTAIELHAINHDLWKSLREYSEHYLYKAGDLCLKDGKIYRCIANYSSEGAFWASSWTEIKLDSEGSFIVDNTSVDIDPNAALVKKQGAYTDAKMTVTWSKTPIEGVLAQFGQTNKLQLMQDKTSQSYYIRSATAGSTTDHSGWQQITLSKDFNPVSHRASFAVGTYSPDIVYVSGDMILVPKDAGHTKYEWYNCKTDYTAAEATWDPNKWEKVEVGGGSGGKAIITTYKQPTISASGQLDISLLEAVSESTDGSGNTISTFPSALQNLDKSKAYKVSIVLVFAKVERAPQTFEGVKIAGSGSVTQVGTHVYVSGSDSDVGAAKTFEFDWISTTSRTISHEVSVTTQGWTVGTNQVGKIQLTRTSASPKIGELFAVEYHCEEVPTASSDILAKATAHSQGA